MPIRIDCDSHFMPKDVFDDVDTSAPHPHAAKLFVNWLVTRENHEAFNRIAGLPGMRRDLSDSWAVKETLLQPGWNYLDSDAPSYQQEIRPKYAQRIKELLSR